MELTTTNRIYDEIAILSPKHIYFLLWVREISFGCYIGIENNHWRIWGRCAGSTPPYGTKFFRFHIHFHQKAPMLGVHTPPNGSTPPTGNPGSTDKSKVFSNRQPASLAGDFDNALFQTMTHWMRRINSNETENSNRTERNWFWKQIVLDHFWTSLLIFGVLPSKLIKIFSIVVGYFLWHSCALLAKIPFDSVSFTWRIDRKHQLLTEAIRFTTCSIGVLLINLARDFFILLPRVGSNWESLFQNRFDTKIKSDSKIRCKLTTKSYLKITCRFHTEIKSDLKIRFHSKFCVPSKFCIDSSLWEHLKFSISSLKQPGRLGACLLEKLQ